MIMRPDLFDTHSLHWHGFPNAAVVFDGVPENSISPVMAASLTYYYKAAVPGTYFYHCHVEATEHMQMGMIGNIWIEPSQDGTSLGGFTRFAYNDGDGSTGYNVVYPVQFTGFDSAFHDAHIGVQPLPFAAMHDDYAMINGRGYPDTISNDDILNMNGDASQPASDTFVAQVGTEFTMDYTGITAISGQRVLLRVSNISSTHQYDIATTLGVPMNVVGREAALLRGPDGHDTSWQATVLRVAPGQAYDVILNTAGVAPGTYFLYSTNLSVLSNGLEERGGLMTEIKIN
jgi:FtsP/CotA-like multicopper oxidase with cupredoxin domain